MTDEATAIWAPPRSVPYRLSTNEGLGPSNVLRLARKAQLQDWDSKLKKAIFRGSTTGGIYNLKNWREKPRSKVVAASITRPDLIDAKFLQLVQYEESEKMELSRLFEQEGLMGERKTYDEQMQHQMVVVVDGNSVADRFAEQLAMGSAVFKVESQHREFWYDDLVPGVHYVSIKSDVSDLLDHLAQAEKSSESLKEIARRGSVFIRRRLSKDSLGCYWVQVLKAYASHFAGPIDPLTAHKCPQHVRKRSVKWMADQFEGG